LTHSNESGEAMKIGITQFALGKVSLDQTLGLCREAGYEAVELVFAEDGRDLNPNMNDGEIEKLGQRCAAAGVEITSVVALYAAGGNLLSRKKEEREQKARCVARSLEIAGVLGVGAVLLHPGALTAEGTYEAAWKDLRDALRGLAPLAEKHRAAIAIENVWNKFLLSPREASQFVDEVGSPWVGFYLDTANMMAYGYPEQWILGLGPRIKRVHFKDFKRREHQFVNLLDGDSDWPAIMKLLRQVGYRGPVIHEVGGDHQTLVDLGARMRRIVAM
jgi:hexulose-6-phosphate isomerase